MVHFHNCNTRFAFKTVSIHSPISKCGGHVVIRSTSDEWVCEFQPSLMHNHLAMATCAKKSHTHDACCSVLWRNYTMWYFCITHASEALGDRLANISILYFTGWKCWIVCPPVLSQLRPCLLRVTHAVKLCIYRPAFGPAKCSPYTQVVFIYRFNNMAIIPLGTCNTWSL